eukprot:XP_028356079.1 39S ribosomal protein L15, mitochondrial isoform X3 [Physeter catodon]
MAGPVRGGGPQALDLLRALPRVSLANLRPNPGSRKPERRPRGQRRGRKCGRGHKGERQRGTRPRLGFEGGQTPFYLRIPKYGFNEGHSFRRQYQPLSLNRLQYLIDLGRVDPTQPIDLTQLVNGRGVTIQPSKRDYGVQLVEEPWRHRQKRLLWEELCGSADPVGKGTDFSQCVLPFPLTSVLCAGCLLPSQVGFPSPKEGSAKPFTRYHVKTRQAPGTFCRNDPTFWETDKGKLHFNPVDPRTTRV